MTNATERKANRLIHATSPYLLQHAYNPVDWFEWGDEALTKAKTENKPILVSIGYSSCHWCHVMERESFEKDDIAAVMNRNFVCIKVDREERPDIDQIYMEAVQAMGGNGGWPLNVFLNPACKPFYGGTYFPPQQWVRVLAQISQVFTDKRMEIDASADEIGRHVAISDLNRFANSPSAEGFNLADLDVMFQQLSSRYDHTWGGLEKAPKFVMPSIWMFLLRFHFITKNQEALTMVTQTLSKMSNAGLYDQLGGGFSRYSVDREWFAPHFEKMLYDNGQLLTLYSEAYAITKQTRFREIVYETVGWLQREMLHRDGGFYSALDADSEGIEGKFYTWTRQEVEEALGPQAKSFINAFGLTENGNWEHGQNILSLQRSVGAADLIAEREKLLHVRGGRIRPALDDKILTGWNAMVIQGLTDAWKTFGDPVFLELAEKAINFIEKNLINNGKVYRSFKGKRSSTEGFLEDYAFLIQAYVALYESTFVEPYLGQAKKWCVYTLSNFFDKGDGFFNYTSQQAEPLIARKKEIFDNVIPASNSIMARNLYRLGTYLDEPTWKEIASKMTLTLAKIIQTEPAYLSQWGVVCAEMVQGLSEVVIAGPDAERLRKEFATSYQPFSLVIGASGESNLSLMEGRSSKDGTTKIYVCFNKTCKLPVTEIPAALEQLEIDDQSGFPDT